MNRRNLLNVVLFQAAWFASVLGAARGMPWLGPLVMVPVLAVHLIYSDDRQAEVRLLLVAGTAGFLFDTGMILCGVFTPVTLLLPAPWSPPWMVGLWLNLATTLNFSLGWLRGRLPLAALFGAIGGPLAYHGGAQLGATLELPSGPSLLVLALGWGGMTPFLVWLAGIRSHHRQHRAG